MKPKVIAWFNAYIIVLCVLYALVAGMGIAFLAVPPETLDAGPIEALFIGFFFIILGLVLFAGCLLPLLVKPRPWLWTYSLIVICLGMTSACFLPACIPLLIFWIKPGVKQYYGCK